jgi:drug/metabolite transporter (DMT)-like permease
MSAVPFCTLLLAHLFQHDEPPTGGKLLGVALGVGGILVLIGPGALAGVGEHVMAELAVLAATLCYAANSIMARRLAGVPADVAAAGMLLAAAAMAVPLSLAVDQPWRLAPSALSVLAVAALGLLPTALGYLLAFRIIARAGAGFASFNNFLVPVFGLFWGVLLLGEQPQPTAVAGLAIVLAGLAAPRLWPARARAG